MKENIYTMIHKFREFLLTPANFTIVITSLVAPMLIQKITTDMEQKKIQADLVKVVLDMTKSTNFNDENELKKFQIYSKIVDDNPGVFNIELSGALDTIDTLFRSEVRDNMIDEIKGKIYTLELKKQKIGQQLNLQPDTSDLEKLPAEQKQKLLEQTSDYSEQLFEIQSEIHRLEDKILIIDNKQE